MHPASRLSAHRTSQAIGPSGTRRTDAAVRRANRILARALAPAAALAGASLTFAPVASGVAGASGAPARGHAARTVKLTESANLRLTSKHGFTLNEQGTASGTARGALYVHLTIVSSARVTAEINFYPSNGSISSRGNAAYHRGRSSASFAGTLSIVHGSGAYGRTHGQDLAFGGTIQRSNDAISVHVSGEVSE